MQARLDPATKRILVALLASPKTPTEVARIYGIPVATVWARIRRLEELHLVHEVLAFIDSSGALRRYFEATLPIDTAEEEIVLEA